MSRASAASMMFLRHAARVQLVRLRSLDEHERHRRRPERLGPVAARGQPLDLIPVVDDHHRPVLAVLRAACPPGGLKHPVEVFLLDGTVLVMTDGPQTENTLQGFTHESAHYRRPDRSWSPLPIAIPGTRTQCTHQTAEHHEEPGLKESPRNTQTRGSPAGGWSNSSENRLVCLPGALWESQGR